MSRRQQYCVEEIVDCFEEFVKRSLLFICMGIVAVFALVLYTLKLLTDKDSPLRGAAERNQNTPALPEGTTPVSSTENSCDNLAKNSSEKSLKNKCKKSRKKSPKKSRVSSPENSSNSLAKNSSVKSCKNSCEKPTISKRAYTKDLKTSQSPKKRTETSKRRMEPIANPDFFRLATHYFWAGYTILTGNYFTVATLVIVLVLSYVLPDITNKVQAKQEINNMKKVLDIVATEVSRAEAACITVANDVCCLQCSVQDGTTETAQELRDLSVSTSGEICATHSEPARPLSPTVGLFRKLFFPNRNASHKEVAIMSYLYTNSFDAMKKTAPVTNNSDED